MISNSPIEPEAIATALNTRVLWDSDKGVHDFEWVRCVEKNIMLIREGRKDPVFYNEALMIIDTAPGTARFRYHFVDPLDATEAFVRLSKEIDEPLMKYESSND